MWKNWLFHKLLVGKQNDADVLENILAILKMLHKRITIQPRNSIPRRSEKTYSHKNLYANVHTITSDSQKVGAW
jgi:hypothetical protein